MEEIKRYMLLKNNIVIAFYSSDIHSDIPNDVIEISEILWGQLLELGQAKLINITKKDNFMIEDFEQNTIELTEKQKLQLELNNLLGWFKEYDETKMKIARDIEQGREPRSDLKALNDEADINAARITEIRKKLKIDE